MFATIKYRTCSLKRVSVSKGVLRDENTTYPDYRQCRCGGRRRGLDVVWTDRSRSASGGNYLGAGDQPCASAPEGRYEGARRHGGGRFCRGFETGPAPQQDNIRDITSGDLKLTSVAEVARPCFAFPYAFPFSFRSRSKDACFTCSVVGSPRGEFQSIRPGFQATVSR